MGPFDLAAKFDAPVLAILRVDSGDTRDRWGEVEAAWDSHLSFWSGTAVGDLFVVAADLYNREPPGTPWLFTVVPDWRSALSLPGRFDRAPVLEPVWHALAPDDPACAAWDEWCRGFGEALDVHRSLYLAAVAAEREARVARLAAEAAAQSAAARRAQYLRLKAEFDPPAPPTP